jgi:hypothetical protein
VSECFLAPVSVAAGSADKGASTFALMDGLIAAVKLARVESQEIVSKSPRVRAAISNSSASPGW